MLYSEVKKIIKAGYRDELESLLNDHDEDVILGYFDNTGELDNFEESHQGQYSSDEDFTQQLIEDIGIKDLPGYIHINWERTANDIMMDYFEIDGHYFRSM